MLIKRFLESIEPKLEQLVRDCIHTTYQDKIVEIQKNIRQLILKFWKIKYSDELLEILEEQNNFVES